MLRKFRSFLFFVSLVFANQIYAANNYYQFAPSPLSPSQSIIAIAWNSDEGIKMLERSQYKNDFYQLASFFQPQINPLYCGIASSVIVMNAIASEQEEVPSQKKLEVLLPNKSRIAFKSYSQLTFLNTDTDLIKNHRIIELKNIKDAKEKIDPGLTLDQLSSILQKAYKLPVSTKHIEKTDEEALTEFRKLVKEIFQDRDNFIIANFDGKAIGLKSGGHISPLVAYDEISDAILVLDVAGHKNPWYWVKLEYLFKAMNTLDGALYRGFLIINDNVKNQPQS